MNKHTDYYRALEVHHDSGQDIIDAAYRCLSKMYHPDINASPTAVERMKSINIAYGVIGDSKKRKVYHSEWLKNNLGKSSVTIVKNKENEENNQVELAEKAINEFFHDTISEDWEKAYTKLSLIDRTNIPLKDFLEWKRAVAKVYKLGNYKISFFRKYKDCEYAGVIYPAIFQFSVKLTEMQILTGQISEENTQKYVSLDGDGYRVCLGYTDLKPIIMKFKYLAQAIPKVDKDEVFIKAITKMDPLTGILSYHGFVEQAEMEMLRSERYGNPLSLAVISLKPIPAANDSFEGNQLDACISYVSEILCGNIRKTDIIGRSGASSFAILFTETKLEEATDALNKLLLIAEDDDYLNYQIYYAIIRLDKGDIRKILKAILEKVTLKEKAVKERSNEEQSESTDAKLGKYKLSDILGFNKKGRNHF